MIVARHKVDTARGWSGLPYFLAHNIRNMNDDVHVFRPRSLKWFRIFSRTVKRVAILFGNNSINLARTRFYSRNIAKEINAEISRVNPDVIVGIIASIELAYVETEKPVIHISDTTFAAMLDYYPEFTGLWSWLKRQGHEIEQRIIDSAAAVVCPSKWAKSSVIQDYNASPEKVHSILFGANLKTLPDLSEQDLDKKFEGKCRLLFIGKDWVRKGGEIVLEAYQQLIDYGLDVELTIIGCKGMKFPAHLGIRVYDYLNKDLEEDLSTFNSIFKQASFFVLPTKAEAYGLVFAEAAAFGTPALGPMTGGVPSIVLDNVTGVLLSETASGIQYADRIMELWSDKEKLKKMSTAARSRFENDLSWDRWSQEFKLVIDKITGIPR